MAKSCAVFCVEFTSYDKDEAEEAAFAFKDNIAKALPISVNVLLEDVIFDLPCVEPCSVHQALERATSRIRRLTDELDEARREICQLMSWDDHIEKFAGGPDEYANRRGWDCFKNFFVGDDDHAKGGM